MKKIIIESVYVVGMHHWGGRELKIGEIYYINHEPSNPKDGKAVAVYTDKEKKFKRGYLRREDANFISLLFKENLGQGHFYLKPKSIPEKFNRRAGPLQRCNIGFRCNEEDVDRIRNICKCKVL